MDVRLSENKKHFKLFQIFHQILTLPCFLWSWFIFLLFFKINSENMITEELETKGISFSRYYNHYPLYYDVIFNIYLLTEILDLSGVFWD